MAQPVAYAPVTAFVSYQAAQPWFPGQNIDVELTNLKATTDQIRTNLALIQRDDGALLNGVVTYAALSPILQTGGLSPLSVWLTGTAYTAFQSVVTGGSLYQCTIAHTSANFATDLAAGKWLLLAVLPVGPTGATGATGATGSTGATGTAATIAAGSTTTGQPGTSATVSNSGSSSAATFNFTIPAGLPAGYSYAFATSVTMADPSAGNIRANNATIASATAIAISVNTAETGNPSIAAALAQWDQSSTTAHRGTLIIRKITAPATFAAFDVTGASVNNTTWYQLALTYLTGNGTFSAADAVAVHWTRSGDAGAGTVAGMTNHGIPVASGATAIGGSIALTDGQVIVGQTGADPLPKTLSGGATLSAAGVVTLSAHVVQDNASSTLASGYLGTSTNGGSVTGANQTITPTPSTSVQNLQYYTLNGSSLTGTLTINPPVGDCTVIFDIINGGSGTVGASFSTSNWTKVTGDTFTTTNGNKFRCYGSVINSVKHLQVTQIV